MKRRRRQNCCSKAFATGHFCKITTNIAAIYSIMWKYKIYKQKKPSIVCLVFSIWPHVLIHIMPDISSLARHLGNNHLTCLIHPWQCSAVMSWYAASIASRKDICSQYEQRFSLTLAYKLGLEHDVICSNIQWESICKFGNKNPLFWSWVSLCVKVQAF